MQGWYCFYRRIKIQGQRQHCFSRGSAPLGCQLLPVMASIAGYLVLRSQPQGYLALGAQSPYTHTRLKRNIPGNRRARQRAPSTGVRHGCRDQHRRPLPRKLLFLVAYPETQDKETDNNNNSLPMPAGSVQTSCFPVPYTPFSQD
jgi:hypothetical protein